jgi:hypothetical protein
VPIALKDFLVEEAYAAIADAHGLGGPVIDVFALEEVVLEFLLRDQIGAASRLWWKYKKGVFSRYPKTITGSWRESDRGGIRLWGKVYHLLTKWKLF